MELNKYIKLESGEEYSLSQLFYGKNKIVIPDLQRDYCWGNKAWNKDKSQYVELVSGFIDNLITSFNETPNDKITLGLIYGYEHPKHCIQLCDGQQRITTLFLLLGIINRKDRNFQKFLISEFELKKDDKEPYLQYSIRESTLYFLSDLVCNFFLKEGIAIKDIEKQDWYFKEYDLDASIQSMIEAIKIIDCKLKEEHEFKYSEFGNYIVNNIKMLYYDMGDRVHGEKTFVIINTTGEPLTATENLKPILLGNITEDENIENSKREQYSKEWEEREEWFWQNRGEKENTSDSGMNDFFIWYWQIRLLQESAWKDKKRNKLNPRELFCKPPVGKEDDNEKVDISIQKWKDSCNPNTIHEYFLALKEVVERCHNDDNIVKILNTIKEDRFGLSFFRNSELHIILPLIAYLVKFKAPLYLYDFIRRLRKNYFDKKRERGNYIDWRHIIQIIEETDESEEASILLYETKPNESSFKNIPNVPLNEWFNDEEKIKSSLKVIHKYEVEKWEDNKDFMGYIEPLIQANESNENSFEKIDELWNTFSILDNCMNEEWSKDHCALSNYLRLYKVLIGCPEINNIYRCSGMKGVRFSWKDCNNNNYFKYLKNKNFLSLFQLKADEDIILIELKKRIKSLIKREDLIIDESNFSESRHLKAWLFIKVLYAEKSNTLLSFHDNIDIASYTDYVKNKLNENLKFSLANSICGYPKCSPANKIQYADNSVWSCPRSLDTILGNAINFDKFKQRDVTEITLEEINQIEQEINSLIDNFYSDNQELALINHDYCYQQLQVNI